MSNKTINILEDYLENYDLIFMIDDEDNKYIKDFSKKVLSSQLFFQDGRRILFLNTKEHKDIAELFYTYEFSDCFKVINKNSRYGGIFNYVDTGILTEEEAFKLILR